MRTVLKLLFLFISIFFIAHLCNKKEFVESELFLSNVEALASGENAGGPCFGIGSLDCPKYHSKVYDIW